MMITDNDDVAEQVNRAISIITGCIQRESGAWCHVWLDGRDVCQCGEKNLSEHSKAVLQ